MWRSIVGRRSRLTISSGSYPIENQHLSPPQHQVHHNHTRSFTFYSFASPTDSLLSPPTNILFPFSQKPRLFSTNPSGSESTSNNEDDLESHFDSTISQTNEDFGAFTDTKPISVESESIDSDHLVEEEQVREVDFEQLDSVLSLLQSSSIDGSLESSLDDMELTLNEDFVVRVLETPLVPGESLIRFFKWALKKPELSATTWTLEALVRAISGSMRKTDAYAVWDLIKETGESEIGILSTNVLNELISLFSKLGKGKAAFEVFNSFDEFGCVADTETYYFTIEALCRRSIFDWACSVSEKMLGSGKLPDSEKVGKVIAYLCKGGKAKDAHLVYLLAKEKDRYPSRSSVNFLISSLCRGDDTVGLALEALDDFSGEERKHAIKPFSSVIRGLCRINDVSGAKSLLLKMIDSGPLPGNAVFNTVINSISKVGDMEEARNMLKLMESRGLKPDVYTYSVIMSGYAKGGEMEEACNVLAKAKEKHSKLSPVTYHILVRGYCKLEEFDKAVKLLGEMREFGVQPNADEYNKLIQSLCLKALDWETAEKLLEKMKENGLHLNGITKALLRAVKEVEEEEAGSGEEAVAM